MMQIRCINIVVSCLLVVVSIIISLFCCEIFLRFFYPQNLYFNISQWDKYVGFCYIPNIEGYSRTDEYEMYVKINSHGLRDKEFDYQKPQKTFRIGIFGDSFTFGEGVQNDQTYPKLLEAKLADFNKTNNLKLDFEVLNFGIGKTGTSNQLAFFQKEGTKYNLNVVILGFNVASFNRNVCGPFYLRDDELIHNPTAFSSIRVLQSIVYKIPFYKWLAIHSHTVNLIRKYITIVDDNMRSKQSKELNLIGSNDEESKREVDITLKLLKSFNQEVTDSGGSFLVVYLPVKGQRTPENYRYTNIPREVNQLTILTERLKKNRIYPLDLTPIFERLPVSQYFFINDGHPNKYGQQVIADNIFEATVNLILRSELYLQYNHLHGAAIKAPSS